METTAVDHTELLARFEQYAQSQAANEESYMVGVGARLGAYMAATSVLLRELCEVDPERARKYIEMMVA